MGPDADEAKAGLDQAPFGVEAMMLHDGLERQTGAIGKAQLQRHRQLPVGQHRSHGAREVEATAVYRQIDQVPMQFLTIVDLEHRLGGHAQAQARAKALTALQPLQLVRIGAAPQPAKRHALAGGAAGFPRQFRLTRRRGHLTVRGRDRRSAGDHALAVADQTKGLALLKLAVKTLHRGDVQGDGLPRGNLHQQHWCRRSIAFLPRQPCPLGAAQAVQQPGDFLRGAYFLEFLLVRHQRDSSTTSGIRCLGVSAECAGSLGCQPCSG